MSKKPIKKLFVVRTYIYAKIAAEALRLERKLKNDDVWIDDDRKRGLVQDKSSAIGFMASSYEDD